MDMTDLSMICIKIYIKLLLIVATSHLGKPQKM